MLPQSANATELAIFALISPGINRTTALNFHASNCKRSRLLAPTIRSFSGRLTDAGIAMLTLDLTDRSPLNIQRQRQVAKRLGGGCIFDEYRHETGQLVFFDTMSGIELGYVHANMPMSKINTMFQQILVRS